MPGQRTLASSKAFDPVASGAMNKTLVRKISKGVEMVATTDAALILAE